MKREVWSVWKEEDGWWRVQLPNGRLEYKTKRQARLVADAMKSMHDSFKKEATGEHA
jgi:hypothetical protein